MNNKEFEDFFKDLEPEDIPVVSGDSEDDLVFSSFFEDETTKKPKVKPAEKEPELPKKKQEFRFEDEVFAPPPPKEDDVPIKKAPEKPAPKKEPEKKKSAPKSVDAESAKNKKRKRRINTAYNWLLTIIWVSAVLAVSVFIASFALSSINDLVGFSKESREITITIPEGSDLSEIAKILEETGVIDEPFTFEVYARVKEMDKRLAPGTYTLNSNLGYDQIFQALKTKEKPKNVVTVNFYEGMTLREIALRLEENGVCGYDEFIEAAKTEKFEYEFENMMGTEETIYLKWEGYLFPDTYEFYTESTPRSVIAKFIENFNRKITAEHYARMQELGMSLEDVITLASVIQSEAAYMEDMEIVSSVFHNRLEPGSGLPYLQSDVTYFYYTENIEPYVEDEALSEEYLYAYYTYTNYRAGIPAGPICSPGMNAIEAALYPENTDYYYFVTDREGNFYYAKTMAEHEANIIKAGRG
ncbi:MAG: endolytic transglycosylase MltG [Oscillospiraceae bacterium]|nr:endolytic transglycosylase MltG [Oscillospiraceae bacterium]